MDFFDALTMIGGLCLFLFGMTVMGQALERRAGNGLRTLLGRMTTGRAAGFLTGCGVTGVIQSSSATTVMVVGFVNSGLMTLRQAINVIMGANVGTTVTSWILSLGGIDSSSPWVKMLKPASFTPILALIGIIFYLFCKKSKTKDTGMILLGFATLMFGMETMSSAVAGLADVPAFRELFIAFKNPVFGLLAGALLTAAIQSSSASVGILQALAVTGQVSYGAAIPIIMGQNIGTCITAIMSSVGTNKNAKRAAFVHLSFNVIGATVLLSVFAAVRAIFAPHILNESATRFGIAVAHSAFNILCVMILMPMASLLEKMACKVIKDKDGSGDKKVCELDERLLAAPPAALDRCRKTACEMGEAALEALKLSLDSFTSYSQGTDDKIHILEDETDNYEDILGSYLVKLSARQLSADDSEEAAGLLKVIGDLERIADHAVNILESAKELHDKKLRLSETASDEFSVISSAVSEILDRALSAFENNDPAAAAEIEPLEEVVDSLRDKLRDRHIRRVQQGECSIEVGFVWSDVLTNLERTADHCSNIAGCILDMTHHNLNTHETLRSAKNEEFYEKYCTFADKYALPEVKK